MPQIRKDPVVDRWVIISTERAKRPGDFSLPPVAKKGGFCPFCEGNEGTTPPETYSLRNSGKPDEPGWRVRVVPNKFPAISNEGTPTRTSNGIYEMIEGCGAHEVIVETTNHDVELPDLPIAQFADVMSTYRSRILKLKADPRIEFIMIFKNSGLLAGASLEHSHTQLVGLPIVPVAISEELESSKRHFDKNRRCLFCDMIGSESGAKARIVMEDANYIAFCPYAPRFPFESWVFPKFHESNFESMDDAEIKPFSSFFKGVIEKYTDTLGAVPYNFMLHTAPTKAAGLKYFHWHIEITPCLTQIAGFERGTGFYINPTPPEDAAKALR